MWKSKSAGGSLIVASAVLLSAVLLAYEAGLRQANPDAGGPRGFSKILEDDYGPGLDPTAKHYLRMIRGSARNMGQLVDDLLKLSRIGRQQLVCEPTDLNTMVESVLQTIQPELEGRRIDWRIAKLPSIDCDPGLIKQVFTNLISNAVKYTRRRAMTVIEIGLV